jgi:isoleucyl-tRNA synthetase
MTQPMPDYKSTIKLPQTSFPMKGDLNIKEPEMIKSWEEKKIYQKIQDKNKNNPAFILPDGPPYANGSIHIGHALNKTLKDFIVKYKSLKGFRSPFIPGWDCHGLPIEHKVMKDLNEKKQVKNDQEILALCRAEASKWVNHQREQFRRLGIFADWENPYLTMAPDYEAEEIREFARAFKKGIVYRGSKPVYWNWTLKTALADAEIEYHQHKSPSIYVKFQVTESESLKKLGSPKGNTYFVIWTTTPWTLPANVGICLHPDFEYGVYSTGTENFIIAKGLKEVFEKETSVTLTELSLHKGADLELLNADHPWIARKSKVVLGLHVSLEAGTGCVHTAPGHGADDFKVGLKYHLDVLCPVDDAGCFTEEVPEWKGMNIFKANPLIVEKLKQSGHLIKVQEIEHSYPHCWRSKTPLIFRTTPQWFLGIDLEGSDIRKKTMEAIKSIKFVPAWGQARFNAMMENRPDWCLSRQRIWGVPIPIFYCIATGEPLADFDVMMKVADVVEKKGIEGFQTTPVAEFLGNKKYACDSDNEKLKAAFGSQGFRHGKDILDVWFDSGVCYAAVQKKREGMSFPADIYLEGSDQHRGWFNTSMLASMATQEVPPFKALLTHGFVMDSQGRKQSKSLGNVIDPNEVSSKSGAEIIRLWASYEDYGQDVSCGKEELTRVTETYRRIRNTMRYLLGSISDFNPTKDIVAVEKMTELDRWALNELYELIEKVEAAYDGYDFYKVYHALNTFCTVTLSSVYLDVLKDRLYTWKENGVPRRGSQTVLFHICETLMSLMAPILSFLAEETYSHYAFKTTESIFLKDFPKNNPAWKNEAIKEKFKSLIEVRTEVQKVLEGLRGQKIIGSSLEAKVTIKADGATYELLKNFAGLQEFLIVSQVVLEKDTLQVAAVKADGEKCVRCWTYSTEIGKVSHLPGICPKCTEALT